MTTQQGNRDRQANSSQAANPGGSGLPTEGGGDQSGLAGEVGTQPGGGNPSVAKEQTNRPADNPEDRNAG
jgi:hypothetical protein